MYSGYGDNYNSPTPFRDDRGDDHGGDRGDDRVLHPEQLHYYNQSQDRSHPVISGGPGGSNASYYRRHYPQMPVGNRYPGDTSQSRPISDLDHDRMPTSTDPPRSTLPVQSPPLPVSQLSEKY